MDETEKRYCTAEEIAHLLGLSVLRIRQLRNDGIMVAEKPKGSKRNAYLLIESLVSYCKHLQDRKSAVRAMERIKVAEADMKEKKAALLDIELRKRKGEVHESRHVSQLLNGMIIETKGALLGIPGRIAVEVSACGNPAESAQIIRHAICDVLADMSAHEYDAEKFRQLVAEDGDISADEEEEDD